VDKPEGAFKSLIRSPAVPAKSPPVVQEAGSRRRPGRMQDVPVELIPLLRGPVAEPQLEGRYGHADDSGPARGLAVALLVSVPVWAGIVYFARWLLF